MFDSFGETIDSIIATDHLQCVIAFRLHFFVAASVIPKRIYRLNISVEVIPMMMSCEYGSQFDLHLIDFL